MRYAGGVAAYFNGRLVARFNLEEDFDAETVSIEVHDQTTFSKFHAIMSTVGGVTGKNVMGFEVHLPVGQSTSNEVVFDATGVFGVNNCSIVVDTYTQINGTTVYACNLDELLDLNPTTYGYQQNVVGTYLEWTVENLIGSKFNSFAMQTPFARSSYGFSFYVRNHADEEYNEAVAVVNEALPELQRGNWSTPLGIAGFRQMRFAVDEPANSVVYVSSYILQYCKPVGVGLCPAIGDYPSVGDGENSPSVCAYGYRGYSYRMCENGVLGDIQTDKCIQKEPSRLQYASSLYNLIMDTNVHIDAPSYMNIIERFYLGENINLPMGLTLNSVTGEISGVPTEEISIDVYTIYGSNSVGVTYAVINISIRKGTCKAEGVFPTTEVGNVAVYDCALGGSYVGTEKRACILGATDGEWQSVTGLCLSVAMLVILIVVAIVIIAIVIFIIVRVNNKAKAVGGVKGKPSSKKSLPKKSEERPVKV